MAISRWNLILHENSFFFFHLERGVLRSYAINNEKKTNSLVLRNYDLCSTRNSLFPFRVQQKQSLHTMIASKSNRNLFVIFMRALCIVGRYHLSPISNAIFPFCISEIVHILHFLSLNSCSLTITFFFASLFQFSFSI